MLTTPRTWRLWLLLALLSAAFASACVTDLSELRRNARRERDAAAEKPDAG